ncbi:MAG: HigA family addiction module antitoxin [Thermodesulfobacteriota bacterium]|nr:HigA family addiction module antitoxin [Thermodesulfobacteriota bacterium]
MRERKRAPVHPGRILNNQYLEPLHLTKTKVAVILGVSRKTISKLANGHASITSDMALRLSRAFQTTPDLWMNLQKNYDLWHAKRQSQEWKKIQPLNFQTA